MSIATVVTQGYGTFGSVNLLPTIGYSIGESVAVVLPPGREGKASDWRLQAAADDGRLNARADDWRLHGAYEDRD